MYLQQNITRGIAGSGSAAPNKPNITYVRAEDILGDIYRDQKGVLIVGNISVKPGALQRMFQVYATPSKQSKPLSSEGDEDMESFKQKFECSTPGDSLEMNEFVQNNIGVGYIIIADNCADGYKRVYGTLCSPMKLKVEKTDDNSGRMFKTTWEQITPTKLVPGFYQGNYDFTLPAQTTEAIALTQATGTHYQLPAYGTTASISVASIDHTTGSLLTIIGNGGADPATLANGVSTAATFVLKGGTPWTALENASITFEVLNDGSTDFLFERSRS